MRAHPGDLLLIKGHHVGHVMRTAEIVEVRGEDGEPPYVVRWEDTGRQSLVFPGPDAMVHPRGRSSAG